MDNRSKAPILRDDTQDHPHGVRSGPQHTGGRISRTLVNFWLDGLLGLTFVVLCVVALIVHFVFPPGVAARGWKLWGLDYMQWASLEFWIIAILGLGILVHVMLHWTWVCSVVSRRLLGRTTIPDDGIRTLYGVGLLISLLLLTACVVGVAQVTMIAPD